MIKAIFLKYVKESTLKGKEVIGLCPFHKDSKASFSGNVDTGLWTCFSKCGGGNLKQFCEKKGIKLAEKLVATYEYKDEKGKLLYAVERWEVPGGGKRFLQKRWNAETQAFENSLGGTRRVLYRLPEMASRPEATVILVEGEKCVEVLEKGMASSANGKPAPDYVVVTSPGGALNWKEEYAEFLKDRHVVILPDNDSPGKGYADKAGGSLSGKAKSVKICLPPGLPAKGDIVDWLDAGNKVSDLWKLIEEAPIAYQEKIDAESMAGLLLEPWQPIQWLIQGVWCHGRGFIAGEPSVGKTWVAMGMAISVATGTKFLGTYEPLNKGPVLFIQEEESRRNFRDKMGMLVKGAKLDSSALEQFWHVTQKMTNLPRDVDALIKTAKEKRVKATFFDSFREIYKGDENDSGQVLLALDALRRLQNETGCSVVLIHHLNKPNKQNETVSIWDRLRGSSALRGWRESIIAMTPGDLPGVARAQFNFKDAPEHLPIDIIRTHEGEDENQTITLTMAADSRGYEIQQTILQYIRENEGEFTIDQVRKKKIAGSPAQRAEACGLLIQAKVAYLNNERRLCTKDFKIKKNKLPKKKEELF